MALDIAAFKVNVKAVSDQIDAEAAHDPYFVMLTAVAADPDAVLALETCTRDVQNLLADLGRCQRFSGTIA